MIPQDKAIKDSTEQEVSTALVQIKAFGATGVGKEECALAIIPVRVKAQKGTKEILTYAFLDPGSSATLAAESLMAQLNVRGQRTRILLRTMGSEAVTDTSSIRGLEIGNLDGKHFIELSEVFSQKTIPVSKDSIPRQDDVEGWTHLKEVKLPSIKAQIGLLIGANVPKALEPRQVINSVDGGPYAVRTNLGWTVNRPLRGGNDSREIKKANSSHLF